jgi:hypothetical protein
VPLQETKPLSSAALVAAIAVLLASAPLIAGHSLTPAQSDVLAQWLQTHPGFRSATDADCDCAASIANEKTGYGRVEDAVPDYHPYTATGDFNHDGRVDFAVILIDMNKSRKLFALVIFNGPLIRSVLRPALFVRNLDLKHAGLSVSRSDSELIFGPFESDDVWIVQPRGKSYTLIYGGDQN